MLVNPPPQLQEILVKSAAEVITALVRSEKYVDVN